MGQCSLLFLDLNKKEGICDLRGSKRRHVMKVKATSVIQSLIQVTYSLSGKFMNLFKYLVMIKYSDNWHW